MNLNQVSTFLTVADCGSFTSAGEKLFISSSAVAQQVRSLEVSLGAKLLYRTTHGVRLTDIGRYFAEECRLLVRKNNEIREKIQIMNYEHENCIVLGISMWQNCSLFYSLWGQFSSLHEQFQIRTVRMSDEFRLKRQGDSFPHLIESIRDREPWQQDYEFLHLCEDRIVFAVPKAHPLAEYESLSYEDMRPYTLVTAPANLAPEPDQLAADAAAAGITVKRSQRYDFPLFTEGSLNNWIIQIPEAWSYLLTDYRIIPGTQESFHEYGFFYREPMNTPLRLFLDFVKTGFLMSESQAQS